MILCDVNVLVNAAIAAAEHHQICLAALQTAIAAGEVIAANATIKAGMVRIATHARVFNPPMDASAAFAFLRHLELHGRAIAVEPDLRHWSLFQAFVQDFQLAGAGVMDAWYAALAIEYNAEWWTCDSGFAKYPGLRWKHLLSQAPTAAAR